MLQQHHIGPAVSCLNQVCLELSCAELGKQTSAAAPKCDLGCEQVGLFGLVGLGLFKQGCLPSGSYL